MPPSLKGHLRRLGGRRAWLLADSRAAGCAGIAAVPSYVVMQPTTLCNLDCAYCYLPFRAADRRMPVAVAEAVAAVGQPLGGGTAASRSSGTAASRWPPAGSTWPR